MAGDDFPELVTVRAESDSTEHKCSEWLRGKRRRLAARELPDDTEHYCSQCLRGGVPVAGCAGTSERGTYALLRGHKGFGRRQGLARA